MTDTHDEVPERKDPVLVRPYIGAGSGGDEMSPGEPQVWPETATLPEPAVEPAPVTEPVATTPPDANTDTVTGTGIETDGGSETEAGDATGPAGDPVLADTAVLPAVTDHPEVPRRSGLTVGQRLLVLVGGVAVALGVVAYLVLGTDDPGPQPGAALPAYTGGVPTAAGTGAPHPSGSVSHSASPSASASTSPSASASISASASVAASASISVPASAPTSVPASPAAPTLDPVPGADRTGAITAASGRCLNLGGLLGIDGSPVQVAGCTGGSAQRFTLATDGTLRVGTRCAQTTGDGSVRVTGCGDQASAQWRGGPGGTLVNPASGQCLTDPGRAGATTTTAACAGGTDQKWTLP